MSSFCTQFNFMHFLWISNKLVIAAGNRTLANKRSISTRNIDAATAAVVKRKRNIGRDMFKNILSIRIIIHSGVYFKNEQIIRKLVVSDLYNTLNYNIIHEESLEV